MKTGVRIWNAECRISNLECRIWNVECGVLCNGVLLNFLRNSSSTPKSGFGIS